MRDSSFKVTVPQPFSFDRCLAYMARSPLECLYKVRERRVVRLVKVEGMTESVLLDITCPDDRALHVRVSPVEGAELGTAGTAAAEPGGTELGAAEAGATVPDAVETGTAGSGGLERGKAGAAELGGRDRALLESYVRDWFDLDRDLEPWQRMAEADPLLGELARSMYGLRLIGIPDLFEALCWAIAGQQVNLAFAYKLKRRLTEAYGAAAVREGRVYRRFPEPAAVAGADVSELRELQLTHAKAAAIREVAALMSRGELSRAAMLQLGDFDAAERELVRVRGIGPWTAHYVRMRCLRDPRAFPIGDAGLHNAVKARLGMERKPTPQELQALFANWAGWEAYATFYLWHSLY